ncbi:Hypothetical predicted protein [Marmota monax]|uniref:Nuclear protein 1 n=1 Tax=Marmota monax TaxID=9995 RepID=A0A5E4CDA4_MARMO|nr:hypothetical protein GHT09_004809 [Marmota monax]VTJ78832.1 Hypothetical predicted protein [Marmota monax]
MATLPPATSPSWQPPGPEDEEASLDEYDLYGLAHPHVGKATPPPPRSFHFRAPPPPQTPLLVSPRTCPSLQAGVLLSPGCMVTPLQCPCPFYPGNPHQPPLPCITVHLHFPLWVPAGGGRKGRTKREAAAHTNRPSPGGHERKLVTKFQNSERKKARR